MFPVWGPRCCASSKPVVPTDLFEPLRIIPTYRPTLTLCAWWMSRDRGGWCRVKSRPENAECVFPGTPGLRYTRKNHCIATPRNDERWDGWRCAARISNENKWLEREWSVSFYDSKIARKYVWHLSHTSNKA